MSTTLPLPPSPLNDEPTFLQKWSPHLFAGTIGGLELLFGGLMVLPVLGWGSFIRFTFSVVLGGFLLIAVLKQSTGEKSKPAPLTLWAILIGILGVVPLVYLVRAYAKNGEVTPAATSAMAGVPTTGAPSTTTVPVTSGTPSTPTPSSTGGSPSPALAFPARTEMLEGFETWMESHGWERLPEIPMEEGSILPAGAREDQQFKVAAPSTEDEQKSGRVLPLSLALCRGGLQINSLNQPGRGNGYFKLYPTDPQKRVLWLHDGDGATYPLGGQATSFTFFPAADSTHDVADIEFVYHPPPWPQFLSHWERVTQGGEYRTDELSPLRKPAVGKTKAATVNYVKLGDLNVQVPYKVKMSLDVHIELRQPDNRRPADPTVLRDLIRSLPLNQRPEILVVTGGKIALRQSIQPGKASATFTGLTQPSYTIYIPQIDGRWWVAVGLQQASR